MHDESDNKLCAVYTLMQYTLTIPIFWLLEHFQTFQLYDLHFPRISEKAIRRTLQVFIMFV